MGKPPDPKTPKPQRKRPRPTTSPPQDGSRFSPLAPQDEEEEDTVETCSARDCNAVPDRPFPDIPLDSGADSFRCLVCAALVCLSHQFPGLKWSRPLAKLVSTPGCELVCLGCLESGVSRGGAKPGAPPATSPAATTPSAPESEGLQELKTELKEEMGMLRASLASIASFLHPPADQTPRPPPQQGGEPHTYASAARRRLRSQDPAQAQRPPPSNLPEYVRQSVSEVCAQQALEAREEEKRSRSIMVAGLEKEPSESPASLKAKLIRVFEAAGTPSGPVVVEAVRLRPPVKAPQRPPSVRVTLDSAAAARSLLAHAKGLRESEFSDVYLREDRHPALVQHFRRLASRCAQLNAAAKDGKVAFKVLYRDARLLKLEDGKPCWGWRDDAEQADAPTQPSDSGTPMEVSQATAPAAPSANGLQDGAGHALASPPIADWAQQVQSESQSFLS